jgi:tRNA (uracil-5-)-methyltransferase TRM9
MKPEIADKLTRITNRFYREQAASFSATRKAPWRGWDCCLACWNQPWESAEVPAPARVLDIGCGNLRFERYLSHCHAGVPWEFYAVDNCRPLLAVPTQSAEQDAALFASVHFQELDIMPRLSAGSFALSAALEAPAANLAVCFGLLHHVPTVERRVALLRNMVEATAPGGLVCVSFWRFMGNEKLAAKTRALQPRALTDTGIAAADLDPNDYLLGWEKRQGVYRYCHHFAEYEIDELVARLGRRVQVVDRFVSDGRTDNLNTYLVLRVRD